MLGKEVALQRGITEWSSKFLARTHREFIKAVKGGLVKSYRKADEPKAPTTFRGSEKELARLLSSYYVGVYKWNYKNEKGAIAFGPALKKLIDTASHVAGTFAEVLLKADCILFLTITELLITTPDLLAEGTD